MEKGDLAIDSRGLIREAYRIEGIGPEDCRTIFLDWALGLPDGHDLHSAVADLMAYYSPKHPDHPMTSVLAESRKDMPARGRRGGRRARPLRGGGQ